MWNCWDMSDTFMHKRSLSQGHADFQRLRNIVLESYRLLLFVSFLVLNSFGHHPLLLYGKGEHEHSSKLLILCSTKESLSQGCPNSVLEGRRPAEFSSNLLQHTCMEVSSMPSKSLISFFRCVWLGLELNSARHRPSRTEFGQPWFSTTWGWVNSDRIFILEWVINLSEA